MTTTPTQVEGKTLVAHDDRSMLLYIDQAFAIEMSVCERCHDEQPTANCDSALFLREYLAAYPSGDKSFERVRILWEAIYSKLIEHKLSYLLCPDGEVGLMNAAVEDLTKKAKA